MINECNPFVTVIFLLNWIIDVIIVLRCPKFHSVRNDCHLFVTVILLLKLDNCKQRSGSSS